MSNWGEFKRRLSYLLRRNDFDGEMDEEIRFHLEMRVDELISSDMPETKARAQARREFGPQTRIRESSRDAWQFSFLEDFISDLRYSLRNVRRNLGFTVSAVLSLALGIGANLAIFGLTMEFLFSHPSVQHSESLAYVIIGGDSNAESPQFRFLKQAHLFDGLAGINPETEVNWHYGDSTRRIWGARITPNFFDVTGTRVAIGRPVYNSDKNQAVLSYGFWKGRLGGDSNIVGRALTFDGALYTVTGILPPDHKSVIGFGFSPDLYLTIDPSPNTQTTVMMYARLPEGATRQSMYPRLLSLCRELDKVYPRPKYKWSSNTEIRAIDGFDRLKMAGEMPIAPFFTLLMVVVGLILLIACANVSSLLLARAVNRQHELAIRQAIGATRARMVQQLLSESFLLAVFGTIAALLMFLLFGAVTTRISLPLPAPIHLRIKPDWRLLSYALGLATLSALVCGLVPALRATKRDVQPALKLEQRTVAARLGFQRGLVIAQLTVSVVLVLAGFLFVRNLMLSNTLNPGFDIHHTVWASMRLVPQQYLSKDPADSSKRLGSVSRRALELLRSTVGIESASTLAVVPLNSNVRFGGDVTVDGHKQVRLLYTGNWIGTDYFKTMHIPLIAGRDFLASDTETAGPVVILNQSMAVRLFGDVNPVGHTLRLLGDPPITVVGVARNSKYFSLGEDKLPAVYWSDAQFPRTETTLNFVLQTSNPEAVLKPVNHLLLQLDPSAAVDVKPVAKALGFALLPSEIGAILLGSMGALGLVLASVGLYGVLAYSVNRRIREIGIRLALGAQPAAVGYLVVRSSLTLVGIGLILGGCLGYFAVSPLTMFLVPDLSPHDPVSIAAVFTTLMFVGVFATGTPVLRAMRVNPTVALRYE